MGIDRFTWTGLAIAVGLSLMGCSSPTQHSALTSPPAIPASNNPSNAAVALESAFAIVTSQGGSFGYGVRFLLRETSGQSGATIDRIDVYGPSGADGTDVGCWKQSLRLDASGTLDTFHSDAGAEWLSYCAPGSGGSTASPSLHVAVSFRDDNGVPGLIVGAVTTLR